MRADVLEELSGIESFINIIISNHYFGKTCDDFVIEVLQDEYFSFALRGNILKKILKKRDFYERKKFENFSELGRIRNKFAHIYLPTLDRKKGEIRYPHPRHPEEDINYKELYDDFTRRNHEAGDYLLNIFNKMGIF